MAFPSVSRYTVYDTHPFKICRLTVSIKYQFPAIAEYS